MAGIIGPNLHKIAHPSHTHSTLPLYTFPEFIKTVRGAGYMFTAKVGVK